MLIVAERLEMDMMRRCRCLALTAMVLAGTGLGSAYAQQAVESITTREGSRATGRTGEPLIDAPAVLPDPSAWPLPNNGMAWQTLAQPTGTPYPTKTVGQYFNSAGLTAAPVGPPNFNVDRQGNEIFTNPVTGISSTFGSTIQRIK